ncbi:hypothetical protein M2298_002266 [Brevibacillus sp. 1238]|nr:hypothetical protein [Brevibacillus sp. 1238]
MKTMLKKSLVLTCLGSTLLIGQAFAAPETMFTNTDSQINNNFDRKGAKKYAEKYAERPGNKNYANYGSNGDGGDCTNFVSQVLHEGGGLDFHGKAGYNRNTKDWYYYGRNVPENTNDKKSRTSSWTGAHQFREHWAVVNGSGGEFAYQAKKYSVKDAIKNFRDIYNDLYEGDIVQYVDASGRTIHSQVVHRFKDGEVYMAQHSVNDSDYTWGTDLPLSEWLDYGGAYVVTIKIKK